MGDSSDDSSAKVYIEASVESSNHFIHIEECKVVNTDNQSFSIIKDGCLHSGSFIQKYFG